MLYSEIKSFIVLELLTVEVFGLRVVATTE